MILSLSVLHKTIDKKGTNKVSYLETLLFNGNKSLLVKYSSVYSPSYNNSWMVCGWNTGKDAVRTATDELLNIIEYISTSPPTAHPSLYIQLLGQLDTCLHSWPTLMAIAFEECLTVDSM